MRALVAVAVGLFAAQAFAHDGEDHSSKAEALAHQLETADTLGFPEVKGGDFQLIDQFGQTRRSADPDGHYQMLFFGYVNCKAICSVALPRMATAVDMLADQGVTVTPVLITVDPERDTVPAMAEGAPHIHPNLVGLTGSEAALDAAYAAFNVEKSLVFEDPVEGPIYAHGSFIYLLGPDGEFETLMPPILGPERMAELVQKYIGDKVQ
ncbi:MAG: SCO family protein [Pseudomonadota bacterium]